jgi:hypothetical protein
MACPGSVKLLEENPTGESRAANDGTLTHELSELLLRVIFENSKEVMPKDVEEDRLDRIKWYVDKCIGIATDLGSRYGSSEVNHAIEAKIHMEELHPQFFGTGDFACWVDWEELHVFDLKDGYQEVSAVGNPELLFYASGIIRKFNLQVDRIIVHIVQPRLESHSLDQYCMKDVTEFERKLVEAARRVDEEPDTFVPGDKQCKWCNTAVCPARHQYLQKEAGLAFPDEDDLTLDIPPVSGFLTERLLHLSKFQGAFKQLFDDIHDELFERARRGETIPGMKLVQKLGNTAWKDPESIAALAEKLGVDQEEIIDRKLKSPTQVKKIKGIDKKLVDAETFRPDNGLALVSNSAKGSAVSLGSFDSTIDGLE